MIFKFPESQVAHKYLDGLPLGIEVGPSSHNPFNIRNSECLNVDRYSDDDPGYLELISAARERLKRPWESAPLDAVVVNAALGQNANKAHNALILSDQIGPILASGAKGNPRQIKRFLNTLLLRQKMAEARGFGDEIKLPVLAKLMLAERFLPGLFDQIASVAVTDSNGHCAELVSLEKLDKAQNSTSSAKTKSSDVVTDAKRGAVQAKSESLPAQSVLPESTLLAQWKSSEAILGWARVLPPLADVDLRPYLFATKDKKDYFGPASVLGHLATVAEKLLGPKISVQALESDLKQLAQPEAAKLFEAVRTKIVGGDSFETQPAGVEGMIVLVKAQPALQGSLVDFLQALPTARLGPWVVSGWQGVIKGEGERSRFKELVEGWAAQSDNSMLSATAKAANKTGKGGR
jgi:hypothetical protein